MARNNADLRDMLLSNEFYMHELNLYLDTHPDDKEALAEFQRYRREFLRLKDEYVARGGVWTVPEVDCSNRWEWINSPWPWEYREGD